MALPDVIGGGDARDAVADDDHAADGRVVARGRRDRRARHGAALRRERHADRPVHPRAAGEPRVVGEAEPRKRRALVVAERRKVLHALQHRDRVGTADPHAATRLDVEPALLGDREQRLPWLDGDPLVLGLEGHLRALPRGGFLDRDRGAFAEPRGGAVAVATECAMKRRSTRSVRANQTTVTASTRPRMPQLQSGAAVVCASSLTALDDRVGAEPVVEVERNGGEERRQRVGADLGERLERRERRQAHCHVRGELEVHPRHGHQRRIGHQVQRRHEPGEDGGEEAAVTDVAPVVVVLVGEIGDLGVEVVAVLGAADAGPAMRVGNGDERRLAVEPLHRQHRADARAPAALALEQHAAEEREPERGENQDRARYAVGEQELARRHEREERGDADDEAVLADRRRVREPLREPDEARKLVERGERADVAPQAGRDEEDGRQNRNDELPQEEERPAPAGRRGAPRGRRPRRR